MSRTAIAAAATMPGLTHVTARYQQSLKPGNGFVRLARRARDTSGFGWIDTWEIWIATPADLAAAEEWMDAHLTALIDAVNEALYVTAAEPATLGLGGATVNGLIIRGAAATEEG